MKLYVGITEQQITGANLKILDLLCMWALDAVTRCAGVSGTLQTQQLGSSTRLNLKRPWPVLKFTSYQPNFETALFCCFVLELPSLLHSFLDHPLELLQVQGGGVVSSELWAALASSSTCSLPSSLIWLGIHWRRAFWSIFGNFAKFVHSDFFIGRIHITNIFFFFLSFLVLPSQ